MSENLIIFNAKIVTPLGFSARKGKEMSQLQIIENGTVEVTDGVITYVGQNRGEERDGYYHHYWHYNAVASVCCLVLLIRIPILFLQVNVQKNSPGV